MTWATRRGLWLAGWLCVGLMAGLTGAIVTVSMLSTRDRISLAGGITVFVVVVVSWAATCVWLGMRWWRWARPDRQASGQERVLVAYGSRRGGAAEIARTVADQLTSVGVPVDVRPAPDVAHLGAYRAVVVGGALSRGRWVPGARRFVRRHRRELEMRPVWLFASDPLAEPTTALDRPPVATVAAAATHVGARNVATFGCRPDSDANGGDVLDPLRVQDWASCVADELESIEGEIVVARPAGST